MRGKIVAWVAMPFLLIGSQPAFAAEDVFSSGAVQRQSAGFAGVNLRWNMRSGVLAPTARLALSMTHLSYDSWSGAAPTRRATAVELGFSKLGRANFFVGGQKLNGLDKRLGIAPAAAALLVVGGLAVGGVAAASLHNGRPRDPATGCPPGIQVCTQ